jgi:hypothetical protein
LRASRTAGFPFIDIASGVHSREALRLRFGREGATPSACSALVVSHHLGGFLLRSFRGLVASRCRSWGSSRFRRRRLGSQGPKALPDSIAAFPATSVSYPSKDDPRLQPHHVTVAVASLVFGSPLSRRAPPSRPCSAVESGTSPRRCRRWKRYRPSWAWFPFKVLRGRRAPALTTPDARSDAASRTSTRSWLRSVPHAHAEAGCEVPGRATPSEDGHHGDPSRPESLLEFAARKGRNLSSWRSRSLSGAEVRDRRSGRRPSWGS